MITLKKILPNDGFVAKLEKTVRLLRTKKQCGLPGKTDVVVVGQIPSELTSLIPSQHKVMYLDFDAFPLYLHWRIVLGFWFNLRHSRRVTVAYFHALLDSVDARVVLTSLDMDVRFHELANQYFKGTFIAVQNSQRFPTRVKWLNKGHYRSHLYSYGVYDLRAYKSRSISFSSAQALGSLKCAEFEKPSSAKSSKAQSIFLVSDVFLDHLMLRPGVFLSLQDLRNRLGIKSRGDLEKGFNQIPDRIWKSELRRFRNNTFMDFHACIALEYIADIRWASKKLGTRVYVLLREGYPGEESIWKHYGGSNWSLLRKSERGTVLTRQDGVFVSQRSTLCLDALGAGRRALFHEICPEGESYDPPITAWWWLQGKSREQFYRRLSHLMSLTDSDFQSNHGYSIQEFVTNGEMSSSWTRLRRQISGNVKKKNYPSADWRIRETTSHD